MTSTKGLLLGAIALALACAAPAADAAITVLNGGAALGPAATAGSGSATLSITTSVDAPVGTTIAIAASLRTSSGSVSSCTDQVGNSYTGSSVANSEVFGVFYGYVTTDLPAGDTISCTFSSSTVGKSMIAVGATGLASSPFDAGNNATGTWSSGALSIGPVPAAGNLATSSELIVYGLTSNNNFSYTEDSNFTSLGTITSNSFMHAGYRVVATNAAVTAAPAPSGTSGAYAGRIVAFKTPSAVGCVPTLGTMDVGAC